MIIQPTNLAPQPPAVASSFLFIFTQIFVPEIGQIAKLGTRTRYAVIVDCGSSGTRAHLFQWHQDPRTSPIDLLRDRQDGKPLTKHITPGLSSFQDHPENAFEYIEPIMKFISDSVPSERHFDTPIYFLGTAGMRLLKDSTQRKIFNVIIRGVRAKFNFSRIKSEVISGSQEGIYSWLSLNEHRKFYNVTSEVISYGVIEMGGASVQVTFELDPQVERRISMQFDPIPDAATTFSEEQTSLVLTSNQTVKLFSTTFLGLGVNSAREAAIDLLIRDHLRSNGLAVFSSDHKNPYTPELIDPCLASGYAESFSRPRALIKNHAPNTQSIGFVTKENEETFKVKLKGSSDFFGCMVLLGRVIRIMRDERLNCPNSESASRKASCPMSLLGTNFIPFERYPFIGLSEMFFTTNEMMNLAGKFDRSKVLRETKRICDMSQATLSETYNNSVTWEDRIVHECFKASWLLTILHEKGLNMPSNYTDFRTVESLDGIEIDWTFGAIFKEVAMSLN